MSSPHTPPGQPERPDAAEMFDTLERALNYAASPAGADRPEGDKPRTCCRLHHQADCGKLVASWHDRIGGPCSCGWWWQGAPVECSPREAQQDDLVEAYADAAEAYYRSRHPKPDEELAALERARSALDLHVAALQQAREAAEERIERVRVALDAKLGESLEDAAKRLTAQLDEELADTLAAQYALARIIELEGQLAEARARRDGPGSPIARLTFLLEELGKRFPGGNNYAAEPPEQILLRLIDGQLAAATQRAEQLTRVLRDARYNEQLQASDPVLCCDIDNVLGDSTSA